MDEADGVVMALHDDSWLARRTALHDRFFEVSKVGDASRLAYPFMRCTPEAAALAPLSLDGSGPSAAERDALIEWCRVSRTALRGNASSWLYTWFDAAGTLYAFQRVPYRDLLRALTATVHLRRMKESSKE